MALRQQLMAAAPPPPGDRTGALMCNDRAGSGCSGGARSGRALALALALVLLFCTPKAWACADFQAAPSSRWSIGTSHTGTVLLTPCGDPFFSLGVNVVDGSAGSLPDSAKAYRWQHFAETRAEWAETARRRLLQWGFNTAGGWSLPPAETGLPSTPVLELGSTAQFVWTDPFDPAVPAQVQRIATEAVAPYRGNPLRIGYFSDNEIGWWNGPLFIAYLGYPPENHTKRRLVSLLRARYEGSWQAFSRDFIPAPDTASFDDLLAGRSPPRLRPGGQGIGAVRAWTAAVAERYYSVMRDALRVADPDALFLGDRLPIYYDPDAVRAMSPYVDVISVNYNVDAADGWVAPYFFDGLRDLSGGKPVLISEWFFAAAENQSGNLNRTGPPRNEANATISNNRNRTGHLMTVATQAQRAHGAGRAAQLLAAVPNVIGVHWFQYADEPPGGRADGEDYNFGLVDVDDRPYDRLVRALRLSNRLARARMVRSLAAAPEAKRELVLPRGDISPTAETFVNWPKSASLVPMTAAPGEVAFGDVHLAWNEQGLYLATIAMDYYDPALLGPLQELPRSEAFRIALGVDAGEGPRRVEIRVVPDEVVQTSEKESRLNFAAQVCLYGSGDRCAAVPGATAHYFGTALDQPRVILKAFIPWFQLGLIEQPLRSALRLDVGVTAFYRSRWMSRSGVEPEAAMAHPENWQPVRLGGAAPDWITDARAGRAVGGSN